MQLVDAPGHLPAREPLAAGAGCGRGSGRRTGLAWGLCGAGDGSQGPTFQTEGRRQGGVADTGVQVPPAALAGLVTSPSLRKVGNEVRFLREQMSTWRTPGSRK